MKTAKSLQKEPWASMNRLKKTNEESPAKLWAKCSRERPGKPQALYEGLSSRPFLESWQLKRVLS